MCCTVLSLIIQRAQSLLLMLMLQLDAILKKNRAKHETEFEMDSMNNYNFRVEYDTISEFQSCGEKFRRSN